MKVNNNLNNIIPNLKQQAQAICKCISEYNVLNDEDILLQIQNKIINEANNGERYLNIYLRKMPKNYTGAHGFSINSIVIDLDKYPTTTMRKVYDELVEWLKTQGFLPQDVSFWCSENQNKNEPIIGIVTVKW